MSEEGAPLRTLRIGRRSNLGNLRIVTFDLLPGGQVRAKVDKLESKESVTFSLPGFKVLDDGSHQDLTLEEMAMLISELDES